jgi:hypothetical protein
MRPQANVSKCYCGPALQEHKHAWQQGLVATVSFEMISRLLLASNFLPGSIL